MSHGERPLKCCVCGIYTVHPSMERTSADVCLKISHGSYIVTDDKECPVSVAIPNSVMVKMEMLHCSSRWSVPTSTYMTQLASMLSISCHIEHLVNQQSQHTTQWSKLWGRTLRHYRQATKADWQCAPHDDFIKRLKARAARKQTGSELSQRGADRDPTSSLRRGSHVKPAF